MKAVLIINDSVVKVTNSVKEAIASVYKLYDNVVWQENEDRIEIRNFVTESNGYQHEGKAILFKGKSTSFLAK